MFLHQYVVVVFLPTLTNFYPCSKPQIIIIKRYNETKIRSQREEKRHKLNRDKSGVLLHNTAVELYQSYEDISKNYCAKN